MVPWRVLTIAGSDSGGGAGIQADLKTIAALGGFGMSVITALTAQNTLGVQDIYEVSPEFVGRQFDAVATDIGVDAAKTGMLGSIEILRIVAGKIRQYRIERLVVDPVLESTGGTPLIGNGGAEAVKAMIGELVPLALVVTPNIPEAELLSGIHIASLRDMEISAAIICSLGAKNVVVKGGHFPGDAAQAVDVLYDGRTFTRFSAERLSARDTHGTGCTFSAAIAAGLAAGKSVPDAVAVAKKHISAAIKGAWRIGGGRGPVNHTPPPGC